MKDYWPIDGTQHHEISREKLFTNSNIEDFLDNESLRIIVATKGMGKTLLLRTKKKILDANEDGTTVIPQNLEYDLPKLQGTISLYGYEDIAIWTNLWKSALIFSILNYHVAFSKLDGNDNLWNYIEDLSIDSSFKRILVTSIIENQRNNPSYFLNELIKRQLSTLHRFFKSFHNLDEILAKYIRHEFIIFIDAFDQTLTDHFAENMVTWKNGQLGLIKASHDLNISNRHVKVYATIRQEAYSSFKDDDREVIRGSALILEYEQFELKSLFEKAIKNYSKDNSIESFFHLEKIHYEWCDESEDLFNYVYRHSTLTPRSIIYFGKAIDKLGLKKLDKIQVETEIRKTINKVGAENLYEDYLLSQKRIFLHTLQNESSIKKLFSLIPSNVLKGNSLKIINSRFAKIMNLNEKDCHPFCELYNIGLLGKVSQKGFPLQQIQVFKKPYEFDWSQNGILKEKSTYLIHPSLQDAIMLEREFYYLNPHNIIGEGKNWKNSGEKNIFPLLFISHSSLDKNIIESLLPKLEEEMNLKIPCDFWYDKWNIKAGGNIHQEIERGVSKSDFVIVFISKNSLKSGWVDSEWRQKHYTEIENNNIQVISIIIDDTTPNELPDFLKKKKALIHTEFATTDEMLNILSDDISEHIIEKNYRLFK